MKTTEFISENINIAQESPEDDIAMVKNNLHTIVRVSADLAGRLQGNEELDEWIKEKIAVAKSMMVTVEDYIVSQQEMNGRDEVPEFDVDHAERMFAENFGMKENDTAQDEQYVACVVNFNRSGDPMVSRTKPISHERAQEVIRNALAKNTFVHPPYMTIYPASAGRLDGREIMKQYPDLSKQLKEGEESWHGITDPELLQNMIADARSMDYDEFYDEYSSMLDDPEEFWSEYHVARSKKRPIKDLTTGISPEDYAAKYPNSPGLKFMNRKDLEEQGVAEVKKNSHGHSKKQQAAIAMAKQGIAEDATAGASMSSTMAVTVETLGGKGTFSRRDVMNKLGKYGSKPQGAGPVTVGKK